MCAWGPVIGVYERPLLNFPHFICLFSILEFRICILSFIEVNGIVLEIKKKLNF